MENKKSSTAERHEIFAQAIADGLHQIEAYKKAYPAAEKWKPNSVYSKASKLARDDKILARVEQLKAKLEKEFLWDSQKSVELLAEIATDECEKTCNRISAIDKLNAMHGFNAPQKSIIDHTSSDGTMASAPPIDFTKMSESALKELLDAFPPAD